MTFINHSVKFKYQGVEGTMMIGTYLLSSHCDKSAMIRTADTYGHRFLDGRTNGMSSDCQTARNLELIANITNSKSSHSMFGSCYFPLVRALSGLDEGE